MKKLTLIILVAMVPFLTIAQKRSKKDRTKVTNASYEFMTITGKSKSAEQLSSSGSGTPVALAKKINISFDFGGLMPTDNLQKNKYKSMAHAVNISAQYGWEFVSANVIKSGPFMIHHYYMKRKK